MVSVLLATALGVTLCELNHDAAFLEQQFDYGLVLFRKDLADEGWSDFEFPRGPGSPQAGS